MIIEYIRTNKDQQGKDEEISVMLADLVDFEKQIPKVQQPEDRLRPENISTFHQLFLSLSLSYDFSPQNSSPYIEFAELLL